MLLKRLLSRFNSRKSIPYPGDAYLESVMRVAYERCDDGPTPNLYRACLAGGDVSARLILTLDSRCLQMWGNGDVGKAVGLLEVWATTMMLTGFQQAQAQDQDALPARIARTFGMLLDSDTGRLETELHAFQKAWRAEIDRQGEAGIRTFARDIVYLRTLRALGDPGVPDFDKLPVPWGVLAEVMLAKPDLNLDITIFTDMRNGLCVIDAWSTGQEKTQETSKVLLG